MSEEDVERLRNKLQLIGTGCGGSGGWVGGTDRRGAPTHYQRATARRTLRPTSRPSRETRKSSRRSARVTSGCAGTLPASRSERNRSDPRHPRPKPQPPPRRSPHRVKFQKTGRLRRRMCDSPSCGARTTPFETRCGPRATACSSSRCGRCRLPLPPRAAAGRAGWLAHPRLAVLLQNEFHLLSVETSDDADPTARHIRQLENRLDKVDARLPIPRTPRSRGRSHPEPSAAVQAMIKYNEAQSIRKTYRQITKRLQDERVGFNNQIAGVEETLGAKEGDFKELSLLASDAVQARDVAAQQRKMVKSRLHKDRIQREKDLADAQSALSQQEALTEEARKRRAHRAEMIAKVGLGPPQSGRGARPRVAVSHHLLSPSPRETWARRRRSG